MRNIILRFILIISVLIEFSSCYEAPSAEQIKPDTLTNWSRTLWNDLDILDNEFDFVDAYSRDGTVYILFRSYNYTDSYHYVVATFNNDQLSFFPAFVSDFDYNKILINSKGEVLLIKLGTNIIMKFSNGRLTDYRPVTYYDGVYEEEVNYITFNKVYIDNSDNLIIYDDHNLILRYSSISNSHIMDKMVFKDELGNTLIPINVALINDRIVFKSSKSDYLYVPNTTNYVKSLCNVSVWPNFITYENNTYFMNGNKIMKLDISNNYSEVYFNKQIDSIQPNSSINVDNEGNLLVYSSQNLFHYSNDEWVDYSDFIVLSNFYTTEILYVSQVSSGSIVILTRDALFVKKK